MFARLQVACAARLVTLAHPHTLHAPPDRNVACVCVCVCVSCARARLHGHRPHEGWPRRLQPPAIRHLLCHIYARRSLPLHISRQGRTRCATRPSALSMRMHEIVTTTLVYLYPYGPWTGICSSLGGFVAEGEARVRRLPKGEGCPDEKMNMMSIELREKQGQGGGAAGPLFGREQPRPVDDDGESRRTRRRDTVAAAVRAHAACAHRRRRREREVGAARS